MTVVACIGLGYLLGSIPFALVLARLGAHVDLRQRGSGNIGATNVMRTAGTPIAIGVAALDAAKGAAVVLLAGRLGGTPSASAAAGVAAVVGHVYPVWLRFSGGKGVATAFGVFGVLLPAGTAVCGAGFVATVWATRYVSLGSVVAIAALPLVALLSQARLPVVAAAAAVACIVVERHRSNIRRLQAGIERRLGQRA